MVPVKMKAKLERKEIEKVVQGLDIEGVGFAKVSLYSRIPGGLLPNELLEGVQTAIVHVAELKTLQERYGSWYIVSLVNHLSKTNKRICTFLQGQGFKARSMGENEYCKKTLVGKISFRQMAFLAGFGSVGLNRMLINQVFGPRFVIGVVLTDAKILPNIPFVKKLCSECGLCQRLCPVKAISRTRFDALKCKNRRKILGKGCAIPCVQACPIGKNL